MHKDLDYYTEKRDATAYGKHTWTVRRTKASYGYTCTLRATAVHVHPQTIVVTIIMKTLNLVLYIVLYVSG